MQRATALYLAAALLSLSPATPARAAEPYPLRWQCGSARADIDAKSGDITVTPKHGRPTTMPFAWFEGGRMVAPWECEETTPCAVDALSALAPDSQPALVLYSFKGVENGVSCEPQD